MSLETPKTQKQLQSEQTRARITGAAIQLFAKKGFYSTSIADLSQASGLTKGALYHHFENKDAIFFAVVAAVRDTFRAAVLRDVLQTKHALDRLTLLFDNHARLLSEDESLCLTLAGLVMEMDGVNPTFMAVLQELFADLTAFIELIILKGQKNDQIRADIDPRLTALNIVGILEGSALPLILNRGEIDYAAMIETVKQILLDGLRP
jgi:TetR/AcrR family fatty acid metabolism transcriptional regulator